MSAAVRKSAVSDEDKLAYEVFRHYGKGKGLRQIRRNIAYYNGKNPLFSEHANKLITKGTVTLSQMAKWVIEERYLNRAKSNSAFLKSKYGVMRDPATCVFDAEVSYASLSRMVDVDSLNISAFRSIEMTRFSMLKESPGSVPDLLADRDDLDRYYHPLFVAAMLLGSDRKEEIAIKVPGFIEWVRGHDEFPRVITAAIKAKSMDREAVEGMLVALHETHSSLHAGVL